MRSIVPLMIVLLACFAGCKKDEKTTGQVSFTISNKVDSLNLQLGQMAYTTSEGNTYQVDLLKYYITNFTFLRADGSTYNAKNYDLIDAENPASWNIQLSGIPNGTYTGLRFYLGVDSTKNFVLDQTGDLDPANNMFWTWSTGYIFFKHEGFFINSNGLQQTLRLHYGGPVALSTIEVPVAFIVDADQKHIDMTFNLNALYNSPTPIDLDVDYDHQSALANERTWLATMNQNFTTAFTITGVH
ncbi:MAG: MbnP family protein [Bacteroidota bacterium]